MPDAADTPLLPLVATGDQSAVEACMDRYGSLVWALARRALRDRQEAEDAVQDIFIDVWRSAGRFDPTIASETTFIATIARRRLVDRVRRISRRPRDTELIEQADVGVTAALPGSAAHISEEAEIAREAIAELSPDQQRVLQLSIYHGLSHDKIAKATGLPLGTVKTHARRGLMRVREALADRASAESGMEVSP